MINSKIHKNSLDTWFARSSQVFDAANVSMERRCVGLINVDYD
jgi:hypothetical protein